MTNKRAAGLLACFRVQFDRDGDTAARDLAIAVGRGMAQDLRERRPRPWMADLAKEFGDVADDGPRDLQPSMHAIVDLLLGAGGHDEGQSRSASVGVQLGRADPDAAARIVGAEPDRDIRDVLGLVIESYRPRLRAECQNCARSMLGDTGSIGAPYAVAVGVLLLPAPLYPEQIAWLLGLGANDRTALDATIDRLAEGREGRRYLTSAPDELSRLTGAPIPDGAVGLTTVGREFVVKHVRRQHGNADAVM